MIGSVFRATAPPTRRLALWAVALLTWIAVLPTPGLAGTATVVTPSALDLRVGQIRALSGRLAMVDGVALPDGLAELEGVAEIRRGTLPGSAAVTIQWNALRIGDRRSVLAAPPLSTFELLASALPAATPIAIVGDTVALRSVYQRLSGSALPSPTLAPSTHMATAAPPLMPSAGIGTAPSPDPAQSATDTTGSGVNQSQTGQNRVIQSGSAPTGTPTPDYQAAKRYVPVTRAARPTPLYPATTSTDPGAGATKSGSKLLGGSSTAASLQPRTNSSAGAPASSSSRVVQTGDTSATEGAASGSAPSDPQESERQGSGGQDGRGAPAPSVTVSGTGAPASGANQGSSAAPVVAIDLTVPLGGAPVESVRFVCAPEVDLATGIVVDRYRRYRIAPDGAPTWIDAGCLRDEATSRALGETTEGCIPLIDFDAGAAIELERRIYAHPSGGPAYHGPCLMRDGARRFPITFTPIGCRLQHEWDAGRTIGLEQPVFSIDGRQGRQIPAGGCAERTDGVAVYPHLVEACSDLMVQIDSVLHAIPQRRTLIATNPPRELVPCQPTPTATVVASGPGGGLHLAAGGDNDARDLLEDYCGSLYVHDVEARVSFATRRWYLRVGTGLEVGTDLRELTGCVLNPHASFDHAHAFTGWRNDDTDRVAWRQVDVLVDLPGHGEVTIATGVEPYGPETYAPLGSANEPADGQLTVGCDTYEQRHHVESLERPDGSILVVEGGTATPALVSSCRAGRSSA